MRRNPAPSVSTWRADAALGGRAIQAEHGVRHRSEATGRDLAAARVARPVGPLVQLGQGSLGAFETALERLANTNIGQATHRFRRAVADSLPEADGAPTLGMFRQDPQALSVTVPSCLQFGVDGVKVEII
jgi:hypothetical protein